VLFACQRYGKLGCKCRLIDEFNDFVVEVFQLITYRESSLLIDPKDSSIAARQQVATVVAHELAHQWFGNLVVRKIEIESLFLIENVCFFVDNGLVDGFM